MIDLPKPGAYVVRAPSASNFAQSQVQHWLDSQEETPFKSCLWLTASPQKEVRNMLEPYLLGRAKAPKGLDVVSVHPLLTRKGPAHAGIRQLCRSLDTLCVLKPALVIIEHAELWFKSTSEALDKRNPMAHMRLLHQWALHAQAHVVTPVQDDLPEWSVFADGLADVSDNGSFDFRPWWPTQWGLHTNLWTDTSLIAKLPLHHILHSPSFSNLKELAQACHRLRFENSSLQGIHVQTEGELSTADSSVLLRMGADSVFWKEQDIKTWLGLPADRIQNVRNPTPEHMQHEPNFARDLHEVFMPGLLTVVSNPTFAVHGLMMLQLAQRWSVHCTMTRFSLMRHMTAQTALRLANWSQATCVFSATREAIYVLKIWADEPSESRYQQWLTSCFRESLSTLFSGDIQFKGYATQAQLLADLYEELEPLSVEDLMASDLNEPAELAEVWDESPENIENNRPWMQRMAHLLKGAPQ